MVSFAIEGADLHNNVRAVIYFSWQAAPFPVQSKLWSSGFNQQNRAQCRGLGKHPRKRTKTGHEIHTQKQKLRSLDD